MSNKAFSMSSLEIPETKILEWEEVTHTEKRFLDCSGFLPLKTTFAVSKLSLGLLLKYGM